jgi:hypothetical protein
MFDGVVLCGVSSEVGAVNVRVIDVTRYSALAHHSTPLHCTVVYCIALHFVAIC